MALPLSIFESSDVLRSTETSPFDSSLLAARLLFYDYVSTTARSQWEVDEHLDNDLEQIARQHERTFPAERCILTTNPLADDLDSRVRFAVERHREEHPKEEVSPPTPGSRASTPLDFYEDGQRYTLEHPPVTEVKFPQGEGVQAGWFAEEHLQRQYFKARDAALAAGRGATGGAGGEKEMDEHSHHNEAFVFAYQVQSYRYENR